MEISKGEADANKCQINICTFCLDCKSFLCKICKEEHDSNNHEIINVAVTNQNLPKCLSHNTICECIYCNNKTACVTCVNNQEKRCKDKLDHGIQIVHCLKEAMKHRKMNYLYNFLSSLSSKEEALCTQYANLSKNHKEEFDNAYSATSLDENFSKTDLEVCFSEPFISVILPRLHPSSSRTASLGEANIFSDHIFGELQIFEEEYGIRESENIRFINNTDNDDEEHGLSPVLLQNIKEFLGEDILFSHWDGTGDISDNLSVDGSSSMKQKLQIEIINFLKKQCAEELDRNEFDYIQTLIYGNYIDNLKLLASARPDMLTMRGGHWGGTPTIIAAQYNRLEILKFLLNLVHNDDYDRDGDTILHHSAYYGSEECTAWIASGKYSYLLNKQNKDGRTPLHWAVYEGHSNDVRILCENNADVEICDNYGNTPLALAEQFDNQLCAAELKKALKKRTQKI